MCGPAAIARLPRILQCTPYLSIIALHQSLPVVTRQTHTADVQPTAADECRLQMPLTSAVQWLVTHEPLDR